MRTSIGSLTQWTVENSPPDDNGADCRTIVAEFSVAANSPVALATAGLFNRKALLGVSLEAAGVKPHVMSDVACTISPPWGAKKNGVFTFRAEMPFTSKLVASLSTVTEGVPLTIALENAEHELNLEPDQVDVVGFIAGR